MRAFALLLPTVLFGCPSDDGKTDDTGDTGETGETGETDETGGDDTADTDPGTAEVTGSAVLWDGQPAVDAEVQFCETICYSSQTDVGGAFAFTEMFEGSYKLDVLGFALSPDLGWIRMHIDLAAAAQYTVPDTLFLPRVIGPESLASGTATFDNIELQASLSSLNTPLGWEDDAFWAGWVAADDIPAVWGVTPAGAVSFVPLGTEVSGPLGLAVSGTGMADGTYDVYSVEVHGQLEGPVGSASVAAGELTASGLTPTLLSWLLFVPQS